jgi:hypothetical protein
VHALVTKEPNKTLHLTVIPLFFMAPEQSTTLPLDPVIERYKRDVDRTLLRENLKLSVEQRFRQLHQLQQFAALKRAPRSSRNDRL